MTNLQSSEEGMYSQERIPHFHSTYESGFRNNGLKFMTNALGVSSKDCAVGRALLTSREACSYLGISPASLSRAINGKLGNATKLRVIRCGRVHRFRREELERWLMENES